VVRIVKLCENPWNEGDIVADEQAT